MALFSETNAAIWTAADLLARLGPIALDRIRTNPPPGAASEQDVLEIQAREDRLCELVDGTLLEKTYESYASYLTGLITHFVAQWAYDNDLGIVLGPDGMLRLASGHIRIPDVSFISWQRLPERKYPRGQIWSLIPDLAVEVISKYNTRAEMEQKLIDYFAAGVRLVWYVYPDPREVRVYVAARQYSTLHESDTLDGGEVLPGLQLKVEELFPDRADSV